MSTRSIKILATLGPGSSSLAQIQALIEAGANSFRLNMSHGSHDAIAQIYAHIRTVEQTLHQPIGVVGDLQGPKLRCGIFVEGIVTLREGDIFTFDRDTKQGDRHRVCLPHQEIFASLKPDASIFVNDGLVKLKVLECSTEHARCIVTVGGEISDRKGVHVPSVILPLSSLSSKDKKDLEFLCNLGVDWIALSFVQRPQDVLEAKALIKGRAKLVAKIEKQPALDSFADILQASDGIMIARGDLGVELPVQSLPPIQKRLIHQCREYGKPVIVATQMLESMIKAPVPTRAEVSDVANAIYEGADAIMLSAESAMGKYPTQAVSTMAAVAAEVEADENYRTLMLAGQRKGAGQYRSPITIAAREIAENGDVQGICCYTQSGLTALSLARERPCVPMLALTPDIRTARHLALVWGVNSRVAPIASRFRDAVVEAIEAARASHMVAHSDRIAITAGVPIKTPGSTNILRLAAMDGSDLHIFE